MTLSPTIFQQQVINIVVDGLEHLLENEGEPSAGGEQHFNRSHLYEIAQRIKTTQVELLEAHADVQLILALQSVEMIFLDIAAYRTISLGALKRLLTTLKSFYAQASVRLRPSVKRAFALQAPVKRAFALQAPELAVELLAVELGVTVTNLTRALMVVERQGYVLTKTP